MATGRNTATRDRHRAAIRRTQPPCALCEQPIDYTLRTPDPMSFEVDHIVAIDNGGPDTLDNKQAAHRKCNRAKWNKIAREVVLICGPPGAGKTTLARSLNLPVFDVDDEQWNGNETLFRSAIREIASKPDARAAVIRSAATISARTAAANLCGATRLVLLDTEVDTCISRIVERRRTKPPIRTQIAAAKDWWLKYEPGPIPLAADAGARVFVTWRSW